MLFSPFLPQLQVSNNKTIPIFSYSNETRWQNGDGNYTSVVENRILNLIHQNIMIQKAQRESFALVSAQHLRYRRNIKESSENVMKHCENFTFVIKSEDPYKVWNNFSIKYKGKTYPYDTYRVKNDGLHVCNSSDDLIQQKWRNVIVQGKKRILYEYCNVSIDSFYYENYTVFKDFIVLFKPTNQNFTMEDYGVISGYFSICSAKHSLSCNDYLVKVKYSEQYNVFNDFSLIYNNRKYDYSEYRIKKNTIEMCASNNLTVLHIWKTRNSLERSELLRSTRCNKRITLNNYIVNEQFTVYFSSRNQYFTNNDYDVRDGVAVVCRKTLRPISFHYTKEDLLMCNDSIINIKYDDEYKVWNNFSILYKNKMYSYTEYRALNDSIKICNSTDNFVKNIWKLRNRWVMWKRHKVNCNNDRVRLDKSYHTVSKQFTVYYSPRRQYFTKYNYDVRDGVAVVCRKTLRPKSFHYTKEDLLMCNDSIINIKYDDEYKVWNNFSILYKNKMYSYTEYRALNDSIKICNSTDNFVKNIWKLRNRWVMWKRHKKNCNNGRVRLHQTYFTVSKQFALYCSPRSQYFTRYDYDVRNGAAIVCSQTLRPLSYQYTKEDLSMCNDSIINIKYDDEYKVWNNFTILYRNKMYSYTEYRALNDGIKICNSTDNFDKNIWTVRNYWVTNLKLFKTCNQPVDYFPLYQGQYDALKDFTVLIRATKLLIEKNDYAIFNGIPFLCVNKCVNSTSTINYEDEYRVWNNFSIMYKSKMYHYFEYRVTNNSLQICNSSDRLIKEKWQNLTALEKRSTAYADCNVHVAGFYHENYTVHKNFSLYFKPTNQSFSRQDYGVISGYLAICSAKLSFSCEESLVKVNYGQTYEIFKNFSVSYKNTVYDYSEYRLSRHGVKICASDDVRVQNIWKTQNKWGKSISAPCDHSYKLNAKEYTVTKEFSLNSTDDGQILNRYEYSVIDDSPYVCKKNARPSYITTNVKIIVVPLFALAVSFICLVLLLVIYCLLPDLRTLPGLNLMSLCFSYLIWQIYLVVFLSSYSHVGKLSSIPCERLFVITQFITYSIVMNAAVNTYHLRKTFCGNTLVKSEEVNQWRKFLKYSVFSWGVPVAVAIVNIVLVKTQVLQFNQLDTLKEDVQSSLRFYQRIELDDENSEGTGSHAEYTGKNVAVHFPAKDELCEEEERNASIKDYHPCVTKRRDKVSIKRDAPSRKRFYQRVVLGNEYNNERIYQHITGDCINGRITPSWTTAVDVYGIQGCLILYISVTFILTAYQIRQKLKAGQSIVPKSNVVKHRKFVLLLKLSMTTALSYWFPLLLSEMTHFNLEVKIALYTVTLLTGAYIGIAFGFTRRNYQLLKRKYFPATERRVNNRVAANEFELKRY